MGDKKTVYTFPIHFGENCYIGDEVLRREYLQYTDRSSAAVTEVAVTQCTDQRCSYWTPFNSAPAEPVGNGDENDVKIELSGDNTVGPAKSELGVDNPVAPADAMGPLNIIAAIIPFESTWSTGTSDVDHLSSSWKSSSGSSFEIQFDDDDDESGESEK